MRYGLDFRKGRTSQSPIEKLETLKPENKLSYSNLKQTMRKSEHKNKYKRLTYHKTDSKSMFMMTMRKSMENPFLGDNMSSDQKSKQIIFSLLIW